MGTAARALRYDALRAAPTTGDTVVQWVQTPNLAAFADQWRRLENEVRARTHLASFDFLAPWFRNYAGEYGGAPLIGLARRHDRLIGVAPFVVRRGTVGRVPVTRVEFAPSDVPAGEFLIADGHADVVEAFIESLVETIRFDVICLDGFDPDSPHLRALQAAAAANGLPIESEAHAYALVDLRGGYQAYYRTLSGHYRRNLNQKARKIAALGAAVDSIHGTADAATVERAIDRLIAITEASYKLEGQRLADHHRRFLADVIRGLASQGRLALPVLSIRGRDAAFILGVLDRGCFYDITLAYDEQFEKLSPGAYLTQRMLETFASAGVHTAISHGAHDYKKHWSSAFMPQTRLFLFAPTLRARATHMIRFSLRPLWARLGAFRTQEPAEAGPDDG
jgi:CelD/BcsL family acetyltransferase involved in cellulose biosynthesis